MVPQRAAMITGFAILWLVGGVFCSYQPGQHVEGELRLSVDQTSRCGPFTSLIPADFRVPTLDGELTIYTDSGSNTLPLLLAAFDAKDASSRSIRIPANRPHARVSQLHTPLIRTAAANLHAMRADICGGIAIRCKAS